MVVTTLWLNCGWRALLSFLGHSAWPAASRGAAVWAPSVPASDDEPLALPNFETAVVLASACSQGKLRNRAKG